MFLVANKIKKYFHGMYKNNANSILFSNGQVLSRINKNLPKVNSINEVEFKVYSQWGDDGIIDWLVNNIEIESKSFIEFGVENYSESNTRFLLEHKNWTGLILDSSEENIKEITNSNDYWKYDLKALYAFVNISNINNLITSWTKNIDLGLLHIDIDGNDYWVWEVINCVEPIILILEYNALFGSDRYITVPYDENFDRTKAHFSNLYFGASLPALHKLSEEKGYSFIGCNLAGNNAYFIRNDKLPNELSKLTIEEGFKESKFRECRDTKGKLTYPSKVEAINTLKGMPVFNILNSEIEKF